MRSADCLWSQPGSGPRLEGCFSKWPGFRQRQAANCLPGRRPNRQRFGNHVAPLGPWTFRWIRARMVPGSFSCVWPFVSSGATRLRAEYLPWATCLPNACLLLRVRHKVDSRIEVERVQRAVSILLSLRLCFRLGAASQAMQPPDVREVIASDETQASRRTLTARLLSEWTGTLSEPAGLEDTKHPARAGKQLLVRVPASQEQ
jgi:hypothetical protein